MRRSGPQVLTSFQLARHKGGFMRPFVNHHRVRRPGSSFRARGRGWRRVWLRRRGRLCAGCQGISSQRFPSARSAAWCPLPLARCES